MEMTELALASCAAVTRNERPQLAEQAVLTKRTPTGARPVGTGPNGEFHERGEKLLSAALRSRYGNPASRDLGAAESLLERAANAGSSTAQAMRAARLRREGSPSDACLAMSLLETLAAGGNPTAQHELGVALAQNEPCYDYNPEAGFRWVQAALAGGHPTAALTLSHFYLYGVGTRQDAGRAQELYEHWHAAHRPKR